MPSREFMDLKISALWNLGVDEVADIAKRLALAPRRVRSGLRRQGIKPPRTTPPPPPEIDQERLKALLATGSCKDAAQELGVGKRKVYRAAAKLGIKKKRGRASRIDMEALTALVAEGQSWSAIGRALGVHATTAQRAWDRRTTRPADPSTCPSA